MHSQAVNDLLNTTKNAASDTVKRELTRARSSWENAIKEEKRRKNSKSSMIGSDKTIESGRGHRIQEPAILVLNHHGTKRLLMIHAHRIVITQVTVGNEGGPSPSHRRLPRIQHGRSNEAKRKGVRVDERVEGTTATIQRRWVGKRGSKEK